MRRRAGARRGFTLIEIMVVVGILVILATLLTSAASGVLGSSRRTVTAEIMDAVAGAIEQFAVEDALRQADADVIVPSIPGTMVDLCVTDPDENRRLVFGRFPPSPLTEFTRDPSLWTLNGICSPCCPSFEPEYPQYDEETYADLASAKLDRLITVYSLVEDSAQSWDTSADVRVRSSDPKVPDYASVESLVLFIKRYSAKGEKMLQAVGEENITNLDEDHVPIARVQPDNRFTDFDPTPDPKQAMDLFEITDAWGRPLRYAVKPPPFDAANGFVRGQAQWELRSAGPDGNFSKMFTNNPSSDDIVRRGP